MAEKYARNKGKNIVVTGYPLFDEFIAKQKNTMNDVWKIKDRNIKRIIWAPHHTIENNENVLGYSCFLLHAQFMFDIASKYKDKIQIAFKPHPLLRSNLYLHSDWGSEKTDGYYQKWRDLENGQLEEGEYIDLFLASDAMILDSGSFINEYLFTEKPILFTIRDQSVANKFNEYGKMAFDKIDKADTLNDIGTYINEVILNGKDPMLETRKIFVREYLLPPNNSSASQNILNYLIRELS
jgi:CDP-glycerol glycerophosphotransferase (TagB/SpsB family)